MTSIAARKTLDTLLCLLAIACSVLLYMTFFATPNYLAGVAPAMLVAAVTAWLTAVRWWRQWVGIGLAMVGFATCTTVMVLGGTLRSGLPTVDTFHQMATGAVGGWARMLSVGLPAAEDPQIIVFLLFLTFTGTYLTMFLALRWDSPTVPVAPPIVLFGIGLVMVATRSIDHFLLAAALAAVSALLILLRASRVRSTVNFPAARPGRWAPLRAALAGVAIAAVAIAVGFAVGTDGVLADGGNRADPRPLVADPPRAPDIITPLAMVKPQLAESPPRNLFTVHMSGSSTVTDIRTASLDRFDGAVWRTNDDYLVAGERLPAADRTIGGSEITAAVTVQSLPSRFLPAIGRPLQLHVLADMPATVDFDWAAGVMMSDEPVASGASYQVVGEYEPARALGRQARPGAAPADHANTQLPDDVPDYLRSLTHLLTDPEPSPVGKLSALETYLRTLPYNTDAAPGHSYADVTRVVKATETREDGFDEQHASAFAIMARLLGYPSHVAVGYRLRGGHDGTFDVTTRDATAWAEVYFDGVGWVAYDPTDPNRHTRNTPPVAAATSTPTSSPVQPTSAPWTTASVTQPPSGGTGVDWPAVVTVVLITLMALVLAAVLVVPAEKVRRRWRRRRTRTTASRVIGAWEEAMDRLTEVKVPLVLSRTPAEVATNAVTQPGERAAAVGQLVTPVTTALFGPDHLSEDADRTAWRLERELRRALYPRWRRLRRPMAWLNPRPLFSRRPAHAARRRR